MTTPDPLTRTTPKALAELGRDATNATALALGITLRGAVFLGGLAIAGLLNAGHADATPNEDQPGWNCHTMGNQHCGEEN